MSMNEPAQASRIEPRWPPALAILGVLFLVALLHPRLSLLPRWLPYIVTLAILVPIAAVALTSSKAWWRIERTMAFLYFAVVEAGLLMSLTRIVAEIVYQSKEITGLALAAVRSDPKTRDVFLVAVSRYGQPEDPRRALEAGFDEHIVKPVAHEALVRALSRAGCRRETP